MQNLISDQGYFSSSRVKVIFYVLIVYCGVLAAFYLTDDDSSRSPTHSRGLQLPSDRYRATRIMNEEFYHRQGSYRDLRDPPKQGESIIERFESKENTPLLPDEGLTQHQSNSEVLCDTPTNFFDVTQTPKGPILRVRHLVDANSRNTTSRAVGPGLHYAKVGIPANFSVQVNTTRKLEFTGRFKYSAIAVGEHHIFVANIPYKETEEEINFTYTAMFPGVYDLYVEEIHMDAQFQVPGSPFRLTVQGAPVDETAIRMHADDLPSCQSLNLDEPVWDDGGWVSRRYAGEWRGTLRSGWVYQRRLCSFDIFSKEDLHLATKLAEPTFILILGSSLDRGIFLSLVDLILTPEEKVYIDQSDITKCWGYAEVQVGNLRVGYQDFRIETEASSSEGADQEIECHDEKRTKEGQEDFLHDAVGFLENLFSKAASTWPDVMTTITRNEEQFRLIMDTMPKEWHGTIYPLYNCKSKWTPYYTFSGLQQQYEKAKRYIAVDGRVQLVDSFAMLSGMKHNTESSPLIMKSNHLHRKCCELDGEMRFCGDSTEMMAQILMGKALTPKGKRAWRESIGRDRDGYIPVTGRKIKVCFDCPASLLPFHIVARPNLTCYESPNGIRSSQSTYAVWDGKLCPEECMKTAPVGEINTESGPVKVRRCKS